MSRSVVLTAALLALASCSGSKSLTSGSTTATTTGGSSSASQGSSSSGSTARSSRGSSSSSSASSSSGSASSGYSSSGSAPPQNPGAPRIFFTDLLSGPNNGGQSGDGAFVTIYGSGFGATQGSSTVAVGGG